MDMCNMFTVNLTSLALGLIDAFADFAIELS
jgi:hypothetical protein